MRSAVLALGDIPYHLVELRYPVITLQTADGEKVTLTDVIILGTFVAPQASGT